MKVQRLLLSNYRGFTQLDLEFGPQITVLAGVNGSGKSGVLRALAALLSQLLREAGASKEGPETLSATDVQIGKPALTLSGTFATATKVHHVQLTRSISDPTKAAEYAKRRDIARFAIRETRKGSKEEKRLNEEIRFLNSLLEGDRDHFTHQTESAKARRKSKRGTYPIAVLYTTSRYLGRLTPRLSGVRAFAPANAYRDALSGAEVSLAAFANWFNALQQGALGSKAASKRILGLTNEVVKDMLPGFSDPRLADTAPPRFFVKKGKTEFELHQLSDGERGLLALAFDLTRRLAIANSGLKNPVAEAEAIVLLDEIELHLHPSWQRSAIRRLIQTFKNCQFIGTTHSPQVIGQARAGSLRLLHYTSSGEIELQPVRQSFGMDSSWILQQIMDTPARDYATEQKLAAVYEAIDANHLRKAKALISKLEAELGTFPELQEMISLVDRLKILKKQ